MSIDDAEQSIGHHVDLQENGMSSPAEPLSRLLVTDLVRLIAAGTGFTTIARFGEQDSTLPIALTEQFTPRTPHDERNPNYGGLLHVAARQERRAPSRLRPVAVALILPERDIAYLRLADGPMTVLTVGRDPNDDPAARNAVADGLDALWQALQDNQTPRRPTGRPFTADPNPTAQAPPPSWPPDHGPSHRQGPHR